MSNDNYMGGTPPVDTNRFATMPKRYWKVTRFNPRWQEGDAREQQVEEITIAGHMMLQMDGGVIAISEVIKYPDGSLAPTIRRLFNHWIDIEEVAIGSTSQQGVVH